MPLSGAERTKKYREKLKLERPEEFERQRKKNLEKIKSKKKKVSELSAEEAETRREKWRKDQKTSRQKKKHKDLAISTIKTQEKSSESDDILIHNLKKKCKIYANKCKRFMTNNEKIKKNVETYRKRYQRYKQKAEKEIESLNLQIKKMKAREEILENTLKKTYRKCTERKEKKTLKKLVTNSENKSVVSKMMGLKGKVREKKKKLRRRDITEITNFYTRDDISRNTAGKREVRTKNKEKVQIRYLLDTLRNTFKKYKAEGGRYSFTTFYLHKPFFVLSPGLSSRSTCLCVKHSNFGFLHTALVKNGLVSGSIRDTLSRASCDVNNYACMWSKCLRCKDKKVQYQEISHEKLQQEVEWSRWEREDHAYKKDGQEMKTKKTGRITKKGTINDLIKMYESDLLLFKKHFFNMTHQQNQYQKAVKDLKDNEALIVCDFSENYQAKLAEEIQAMHYGASNLQICLHTGMVFWKDRSQSFCTLSDNTSHQPAAIWAHLTPVIDMIKRETPETTIIHFYSDGPSSQYRQKQNFYLLVHYTKKYLLQYTTWSFYEAGHGKNVADGIGGSIKRTLDRKVCIGNDVIDAKDAYNLLTPCLKATKVFLIDTSAIENISKILPAKIPVLKGTMQLHQITTSQNDSFIVKYRDISCFCGEHRGQCACFAPKLHSVIEFTKDPKMNIAHDSFSVELSQDLFADLNYIEETFDLNNIDINNLSLTFEQKDDILSIGKLDAEDSLQLSTINNEETTFSHTEKDFARNNCLDKSATSSQLIDVKEIKTLNLPQGKTSTKKRHNNSSSCVVDPKKVLIKIPQVKRQPEKLLTGNKGVDEKYPILIIKDEIVPASSSTKKNSPGNRNAGKDQGNSICKKHGLASNSILLECHKCLSSIVGQKGKCVCCKSWYCRDCIPGPIDSDYICESCLESED